MRKFLFITFSLSALMFSAGCHGIPPVQTLSEANQKLIKICETEYQMTPVLKSFDHTVWIYLPTENPIFDYESTPEGMKKSKDPQENLSVRYLDGEFKDKSFQIEYDIAKTVSYPIDYGYKNIYTESYRLEQNHLLTAIHRAYGDLEEIPGGLEKPQDTREADNRKTFIDAHVKTDPPPEFIVMIIADVKKGIQITNTFSYKDFKQVMSASLPQEEYTKRGLTDVEGRQSIIGDTIGTHVDFRDLTWPDFLAKQILNRIRFKYQTSDFKPGEDTEMEIMTIVAETLQTYNFKDFSAVQLHNLVDKKDFTFDQPQIKTFMEK